MPRRREIPAADLGALLRRKTRTLFTLLSVIAAFLLFGLLDSVRSAFASAGQQRRRRRPPGHGLEDQLHACRCRRACWRGSSAVPGVDERDLRELVRRHLPGSEEFLSNRRWRRTSSTSIRNGSMIAGPSARRFATRAPARWSASSWRSSSTGRSATRFRCRRRSSRRRDGSNTWTFDLVGIYTVDRSEAEGPGERAVLQLGLFRRGARVRQRQRRLVRRRAWPTANQAEQVAQAIDALSANSDHETQTQTEQAFNARFVSQFGDIGLIVGAIMGAVFFTLILLTGNTMAQAVRERIPELAVLKTIGFSNRSVLRLVLAESVLLIAARRRRRAAAGRPGGRRAASAIGAAAADAAGRRGDLAARAGADDADRTDRRRAAGAGAACACASSMRWPDAEAHAHGSIGSHGRLVLGSCSLVARWRVLVLVLAPWWLLLAACWCWRSGWLSTRIGRQAWSVTQVGICDDPAAARLLARWSSSASPAWSACWWRCWRWRRASRRRCKQTRQRRHRDRDARRRADRAQVGARSRQRRR